MLPHLPRGCLTVSSIQSFDHCVVGVGGGGVHDLALHPVVGLVLQAGDAEKFPQALGRESLDPCSQSACRVRVSQLWSRFTAWDKLSSVHPTPDDASDPWAG